MWRKAATEAGASVALSPSGVPHFYKHFSIHPFFVRNRSKKKSICDPIVKMQNEK